MICANQYHTRLCGKVSENDIGKTVRVAGWVENIRDHGGVQFLDVRDHYGVVQVVVHDEEMLRDVSRECTVSVEGTVTLRMRTPSTRSSPPARWRSRRKP